MCVALKIIVVAIAKFIYNISLSFTVFRLLTDFVCLYTYEF